MRIACITVLTLLCSISLAQVPDGVDVFETVQAVQPTMTLLGQPTRVVRFEVQKVAQLRSLTVFERTAVETYMVYWGPKLSEVNRAATRDGLELMIMLEVCHAESLVWKPNMYMFAGQLYQFALENTYMYVDVELPQVGTFQPPPYERVMPSREFQRTELERAGAIRMISEIEALWLRPADLECSEASTKAPVTRYPEQVGAIRRDYGGSIAYNIGSGWIGWYNYPTPKVKPSEDCGPPPPGGIPEPPIPEPPIDPPPVPPIPEPPIDPPPVPPVPPPGWCPPGGGGNTNPNPPGEYFKPPKPAPHMPPRPPGSIKLPPGPHPAKPSGG